MENTKLHLLTLILLVINVANYFSDKGTLKDTFPEPSEFRSKTTGNAAVKVVINEMMVDPTPVTGLPDAEWIEIWNYGNIPVNLKGWKLFVGSVSRTFPEAVINPGQYMIICSVQTSAPLQTFGTTLPLSTLPALRNNGNRISLADANGTMVDIIDYSDTWYGNPQKKNGGWSLERMDPERNCGQSSNWMASVHPMGGTPGMVNSVYGPNTDTQKPTILSAVALSLTSVEIIFSEPMDTFNLHRNENFILSDGMASPERSEWKDESSVCLFWKQPIEINKTYELRFENLSDACGNLLSDKKAEIQWLTLKPGDLLINEILFNPRPTGADFVEIFNASAKKIETGKIVLATWDANLQIKSPVSLKSASTILYPGDYLAVTTDTMGVLSFYQVPDSAHLKEISSLPPFNNDEGCVLLLNDSMKILDEFCYSEDMHHPMLFDVEGVSLERINPSVAAGTKENWQSASSMAGYATPGYRNSQYRIEKVGKTKVVFTQRAISPDNDGYNDQLLVYYETKGSGWIANGQLFDTRGIPICQVLNNQILSAQGMIPWDGKSETGRLLPPGAYIFILELFDLYGDREFYKEAVYITVSGE